MPKIDLTQDEINVLVQAIESEIKSAKRAQNSAKSPVISEVYKAIEINYYNLRQKLHMNSPLKS